MKSYPDAAEVLADLGDKVVGAIAASVCAARDDLTAYRMAYPHFVAESSKRGLANWIHDRLWSHLCSQLDGVPGVVLVDDGPTREVAFGLNYRMRLKRHHADGDVSTYPTATALDFFEQAQLTLPGLDQINLIAGYLWVEDTHQVGAAVLSLRDGRDNIMWLEEFPETDEGTGRADVVPIGPADDGPSAPVVDISPLISGSATEGDEGE